MLRLNLEGIQNATQWNDAGISTPQYDVAAMRKQTLAQPKWLHFGAGNLFRGFIASLQEDALNAGTAESGIIAVESFDDEIISKIYRPYDNLGLLVTLCADGDTRMQVLASIAGALTTSSEDFASLKQCFSDAGLQMVSFTITEKGYALNDAAGRLLPVVAQDIQAGLEKPRHVMAVVTSLLHERFAANAAPIALVSMDNCSHNGEKLRAAVLHIAKSWEEAGITKPGFYAYVANEALVSFPWTMIDKITPRPADSITQKLTSMSIADMAPITTGKNTYIAPFINTEEAQYLVIEHAFPNGCPMHEGHGVYFTDRDTVNKTERMKVTTCLNPLHTALAVLGCLLGYTSISAEMKDPDLVELVRRIGYAEGLPVVTHPGILHPKDFIDEVINIRFPNPFIPDTPQRIATDTSQKVGIRFGETIKSYMNDPARDVTSLRFIPLALAAWLRYLLAVDDEGQAFERSPDPLLPMLDEALKGINMGQTESVDGKLDAILSNASIFGTDLVRAGLSTTIEQYVKQMVEGKGAVRKTLQAALKQ